MQRTEDKSAQIISPVHWRISETQCVSFVSYQASKRSKIYHKGTGKDHVVSKITRMPGVDWSEIS